MPMVPRRGSFRAYRQRKSWLSSSVEGTLKARTSTHCGLTPLKACLIVLSLPEASRPCSTTSTAYVSCAARRSWYSASRSVPCRSTLLALSASSLPKSEVKPGSKSRGRVTADPGLTLKSTANSFRRLRPRSAIAVRLELVDVVAEFEGVVGAGERFDVELFHGDVRRGQPLAHRLEERVVALEVSDRLLQAGRQAVGADFFPLALAEGVRVDRDGRRGPQLALHALAAGRDLPP